MCRSFFERAAVYGTAIGAGSFCVAAMLAWLPPALRTWRPSPTVAARLEPMAMANVELPTRLPTGPGEPARERREPNCGWTTKPPPGVRARPPLASERLPKPIELASCPGVQIVEWRPTPGQCEETSPSAAAVAAVDTACAEAHRALVVFIGERRLAPLSGISMRIDVSLIPFEGDLGRQYRNLDDVAWRFTWRASAAQGKPMWVVGEFSGGPRTGNRPAIYMRNDVLTRDGDVNAGFRGTLAHELMHAAVVELSLLGRYPNHARNEELAEEFEAYFLRGAFRD